MPIGSARARLRAASASLSAIAALAGLLSCSPVFISEEPASGTASRRLYVNDSAPNDSLSRHIVRQGVKFVLQPGKPYVLSVATARTGDVLDVHSYQGNALRAFNQIPATSDGARQLFALSTPNSSAGFFMARLLSGGQAAAPVGRVLLASQDTSRYDTLKVKLLFMQALTGYDTQAKKEAFAASFFLQMNNLLRPFGIVAAGIHEIVDPGAGPLDFPFTNLYVPLAGKREPGYAHVYFVERISVPNPDNGPAGLVLGFAPREVVDLSQHRESRVLLANQQSDIARLAITATHELGHFFGLRHTVSTRHDKLQDDDFSNVEDGFADTKFCDIDRSFVAKRAAAGEEDQEIAGPSASDPFAGPYCLRVLGDACIASCDVRNLMHPVECQGIRQVELTATQSAFLKRNLSLYRR